ncbi:MAG: D-Ala-D-Ala carboxypeptidase family metallohydrolase, partial [Gemmatimonadota bacterium]
VAAPRDPARWPGHRGRLEEKALAYHVTALVDAGGTRVEVGPVRVAQDEIDTAHQEYIEYLRRIVPDRGTFGAATGVQAILGDGALEGRFNTGDYDVHLATRDLAAGVDALGAEFVRHRAGADGLVVVSGYRNPVHQNDHVGATAVESRHLYGRAVDLRVDAPGVDSAEEGWHMIAHAARNATDAACVAPERIWNRDGTTAPEHLHVDLRASCPRGW